MEVVLTEPRVGPGVDQQPGDQISVPDEEARRMIARGQAKPVDREPQTAVGRRSFETAAHRIKR